MDFAAQLARSPKPPTQIAKIAGENRLACQLPSLDDVDAAGDLLNALKAQLTGTNPETLNRLHNLDGILCFFQI
jgi:hypothetical protein